MSQSALARACRLSQGAISNYESGSRRKAQDVFELADALRVNPTWLATGAGPMERPVNVLPPPPGAAQAHTLADSAVGAYWPFPRISPHDFTTLAPQERAVIEDTVLSLLRSFRRK